MTSFSTTSINLLYEHAALLTRFFIAAVTHLLTLVGALSVELVARKPLASSIHCVSHDNECTKVSDNQRQSVTLNALSQ